MSGPGRSLRERTVHAIKWSFASSVAGQGIRFVASVVLARLLTPADFGIIGMTTLPLGFLRLFGESGCYNALVVDEELERRSGVAGLIVSLGLSLLLMALTVALAPALASFFDEPSLVNILRWASLTLPLSAIRVVPRAVLARRLAFRGLMLGQVVAFLVGSLVAIGCAARGMGAGALIAQTLVTEVVLLVLTALQARWLPRVMPTAQDFRHMFRHSTAITGYDAINYWARNVDNLLIGRMLGSEALGVYTRAYFLMTLPLNQIVARIGSVMVPALSQLRSEPGRAFAGQLRALDMVTLLGFPMSLGMCCTAEPLILTLYGPAWSEVIPIFRILAFVAAMQVAISPGGWLYMALQRTREYFLWGTSCSLAVGASIVIGSFSGTLMGISLAYLIGNVVVVVPAIVVPARAAGGRARDAFKRMAPQAVSSVVMAAATTAVDWLLRSQAPWLRLMVDVGVGVVVYTLVLTRWRPGVFRELLLVARGRN